MFKNIGSKIKTLTKVICLFGIFSSIVFSLPILREKPVYGILVIIGGSLLSWVGSFIAYGFGEIVENTTIMAENSAILKELALKQAAANKKETAE